MIRILEKFDKVLANKFLDRLPKELRTKYFDFEPINYSEEKFCDKLLKEIQKSYDTCKYYRETVCKQYKFDIPDEISMKDLESIPYLPGHIYKESCEHFLKLNKIPSEEIVLFSMSSSTTNDPSLVPRNIEDFDQIQYNAIKLFSEFMHWKDSKNAMSFNFSPNRAFMALMAKARLNNPEHKKKFGEKVRYFTTCFNKPKEFYGTVKYMIQIQLGRSAKETIKSGSKRGAFKLDIQGMIKIIEEILKTGRYKKKEFNRIHFGGSTLLMYNMIANGMYNKEIRLDLSNRCHVSTGGGGWDGIKGEIKIPNPINKQEFINMYKECLNCSNSDFTDIYAFTESPVLFGSHWSEKYQDFIYHCPDYARILVRDSDNLNTVNEGQTGLLEVITPYGVNGTVNQAMLIDDIVELISKNKCSECGYEGATFRILGRFKNTQGKSCSSLFNWIF